MVVAVLAVLKAGAGYVPLDPAFPPSRLGFMLSDSGAEVMITRSGVIALEDGSTTRRVLLDVDAADIDREDETDLFVDVSETDLAYVIYTSGSTGLPKGVQVEHGNVINFLQAMSTRPGITRDDTVVSVTTLSFDISVLELFLPLVHGAQVVIADQDTTVDAAALARLLDTSEASMMQATPTTWRMLIDDGWAGRTGLIALCGGEPMPPDLAEPLLNRGLQLWNMYGPTETTVWSTVHRVHQGDLATGSVPIGAPIDNTWCYVLDARLQPLPLGVPGELFIGGSGVARGYLNRAELTSERFVPDPFSSVPGARMYRTGDVAVWRADGLLEHRGRVDHQVKVRGHRIELGEIEHGLVSHPGVNAAVVTTWEPSPGDVRLVGYYMPVEGPVEADALRDHLRVGLPGYMIPAFYVPMEAFPLTPNNKIDRKQLPAPTLTGRVRSRRRAQNPLQAQLVEIWAEVLGQPDVGIDDDFFDLGGHSLLATQIVSRVRAGVGVELPLRAMFDHPTVAGMAEQIGLLDAGVGSELLLPEIAPVGRDRPLPLSAAQERMWFIHELQPESAAYNMAGAIRLRGQLDVDALAGAFDDLVARHEGLRTTFPLVDGEPVQLIVPEAFSALEVLDRRSVPPSHRMALIAEELHEAAQRPFRLDELPLARCVLYVVDDNDHVLFSNMHHIIGDQWSFGLLSRDLSACYNARLAGQEPLLPPLAIQFGDYVQWHRGWIESGGIDTQIDYWRHRLAGHPTTELPADRPRPPIQTSNGAKLIVPLPDHIRRGIDELCSRCRVSPFMVLLAALDVLVHRYTGTDDIVVGTAIANRNRLESEDLIGTFVNALVMRTDVGGDPSFIELLEQVQRVALEAYANQDVPFATVVSELRPDRDLSRSPLFQIFLNVLNAPFEVPHMDGLTVEPIPIDSGAAQFDVSLSVDLSTAATATFEYSTDLFDASTVEGWASHLLAVLERVVVDPGLRVDEVDLLTAAERVELEAAWSGPVVPVDEAVAVHTLVEQQVALTPDRVAVRFGEESVTYEGLNSRANQVAHHLIGLGVSRGDLVGVHLERSVDSVVAVLAALKAGAAYVPLDPGLPAGRLEYMVEDTAASVVITRADVLADFPEGRGADGPLKVLLDDDHDVIAAFSVANPGVAVSGDDRCHVIYTSGSTGRPKGVEVEHRSVVNFLHGMAARLGTSSDDVVLGATTLSFDPSVLELFLPLLQGAQIVVADRDTTVDPAALAALLHSSGVTIMQATPTTWRMLVDYGWQGEPDLTALYGGEAMSPDLVTAMLARCRSLWNLYGPTETTVWSTLHKVDPNADLRRGSVPVGTPVANAHCYVLDANLRPVPVGVPGELYIGGLGVARGYLNQPALTKERFVRDPFAAAPGARMYWTGDLARLLPDGTLDLQGRADHQVKIRGHRIELGEIEQNLAGHPRVRAAVVTTYEPSPRDVRLVAYYIPDLDDPPEPSELRDHLRAILSGPMVPAAYVPLSEFPLTSSNKIARNQLPPPPATALTRAGSRRPPQTPLQAELAGIWAEVLDQPDIGIDDDFFDLGGHSLLATKVFAEIERLTGQRLPLSALFQAPTIAGLCELLATELPAARWTSLVAMQPEGDRPPFFYVSPYLITLLSFTHLARYMQPDQPFYVLQPQGMEGDHPAHHRVEDMAAHYIAEMRQVQPSGPYRLGGHCAGSWVAFEMATQLQADGEEVALLFAVDSEPPNVAPPRIHLLRHIIDRVRHYRRDGQLFDSVYWQVRLRLDRHISRRFATGDKQRLAALRHAHSEAHRRYQAGTFDGDLVLIRSQDWADRPDKDWHLRWEELVTGRLVVDTVPGTHGELVENASSAALADRIRSAVDRVASLAIIVPCFIGPPLGWESLVSLPGY